MKTSSPKPPKWATRLLHWYCQPALLEDLEGDLHEYFERNIKYKGISRAKFIYILDVLKFFRTYTIRKPEFLNLLIHSIMFTSYVKTSTRNIARNKLFSTINIVGLSISMSVGLIIIAMLFDLYSYDKFHENHNRIYRVISQHQTGNNDNYDFNATASLKAAKSIQESFEEVEAVAVLQRTFSGDLSFGEKTVPLSGFWANESFFKVFSFQLLQGDPATALKNPFSLILTETSARKLFGNVNVLGKTIVLNNERAYTVTGVLKDIPVFSHMKFDMLGSLTTWEIITENVEQEMSWVNVWNSWAYVLLPADLDVNVLKTRLDQLCVQENRSIENAAIKLELQALDDIITGENHSNQIGQVMGSTPVWMLGGLSLIVILSACLNYTNLSIARSFRRSREVGIRKTIGALKEHIASQFITESMMIALLALVFALVLFLFIKPHFISMEPSLQELLVLQLSPKLIASFILFALIVGISAGIFPAIFFAKMNAVQILKNLTAVPVFKGLTFRKVLIGFQYCISIMSICATIVIYKQYSHFIAYDLGFTTENILNISLQGNKAELLKKELLELPEVKNISQSTLITSTGNAWIVNMKNLADPHDSATVFFNIVDENYFPLHNHRLISGRNFTGQLNSKEESEVIVNQHVLNRFNIAGKDPEKAIDQIVYVNNKPLRIIGVMKDFEYGRANNRGPKEVIMRYSKDASNYLNVKILSDDWPSTYSKIEAAWKRIDPVHELHAKFYTEEIEEAFVGLKASVKVGGFLAVLVICIASIGLLGMVVFTTETRLKEISIRKVLGASERRLLYMLSKGFLGMLMAAAAIALPITYLFFEKVLLPNIANHAPLNLTELLLGVFAVVIIALLMIGSQTLKVARTNPAEILKVE